MGEPNLVIKYDGGDAIDHHVEMRALAKSMLGFERIISDGLILIGENRLPRRRERHSIRVKAREPVTGSSEIPIDLTQAAGLLPLGWWLMQTGAGEMIGHWVAFVLSWFGGRRSEAEKHLQTIERLREIEGNERLQSEAMMHDQISGFRDQTFALLSRLVGPSIDAVTPVGPSVSEIQLRRVGFSNITVDVPMADAIRAKGELELSDLQTVELRVDGFVHHSRKLNVENPMEPGGYISADVRDPVFESVPNFYTDAAATKALIRVQAKFAYRGARLERIYIMDNGGRLDDVA